MDCMESNVQESQRTWKNCVLAKTQHENIFMRMEDVHNQYIWLKIKYSSNNNLNDEDPFQYIMTNIANFKEKGTVMLMGDNNVRIGKLQLALCIKKGHLLSLAEDEAVWRKHSVDESKEVKHFGEDLFNFCN
jgi:hypothetical protein